MECIRAFSGIGNCEPDDRCAVSDFLFKYGTPDESGGNVGEQSCLLADAGL